MSRFLYRSAPKYPIKRAKVVLKSARTFGQRALAVATPEQAPLIEAHLTAVTSTLDTIYLTGMWRGVSAAEWNARRFEAMNRAEQAGLNPWAKKKHYGL